MIGYVLRVVYLAISGTELAGGIIVGLLTILSTLVIYLIKKIDSSVKRARDNSDRVRKTHVTKELCEERSGNIEKKMNNLNTKLDDIQETLENMNGDANN